MNQIKLIISCNQNVFPVPSDGPKDVTVKPLVGEEDLKEGDKLELECSVKESNPEVKQFTWYKNNNKLKQQTSKILTISNVKTDDRGSYHCWADNGIKSEKSNEILVSIKCKYCHFHFTKNMLKYLIKYKFKLQYMLPNEAVITVVVLLVWNAFAKRKFELDAESLHINQL